MPRAIRFECTAYQHDCNNRDDLFLSLTPDHLAEVRQIACETGSPIRGRHCFHYSFRRIEGLQGDWALEIRGPERPLLVHIRQQMSPVA
jgi:hypothetical protein